jgi:hypothetical protein
MTFDEAQCSVESKGGIISQVDQPADQPHQSRNPETKQQVMLPDLQLNDLLRLRKPHPCGSYEWTVVRLGADIGLECKGCGHRVMLTRRELAKRMKANLTRKDEQQPS